MTYAPQIIYGIVGWARAWESVALIFGFSLTARTCRHGWAFV